MKSEVSLLKKRAVTLFWLFCLVWGAVAILLFFPSGGVPLCMVAIIWGCLYILLR